VTVTAPEIPRPSTWFAWHAGLIGPGARVLDFVAGKGRHGWAAAQLGAHTTLVAPDQATVDQGQALAQQLGVTVEWRIANLAETAEPLGCFEVVLLFNYLNRSRMPWILEHVAPGGVLLAEAHLEAQRELGWGPTDPDQLLHPGELARLVQPLEILHGREVLEPVGDERWRAVASIAARRPER
jgi:hypothetical protein